MRKEEKETVSQKLQHSTKLSTCNSFFSCDGSAFFSIWKKFLNPIIIICHSRRVHIRPEVMPIHIRRRCKLPGEICFCPMEWCKKTGNIHFTWFEWSLSDVIHHILGTSFHGEEYFQSHCLNIGQSTS